MKLAIIGGGSTYTPELLEGLIQRNGELGLTEVALMDIRPDRMQPVAEFCGRMVRRGGAPFRLTSTTDRRAAIDGAAFVVNQIRVGLNEARHQDILLGLRHGLIGQETTGVGGFAKGLRTIPVALDIARTVEECAPDAWLVNFANPSGMVTEALSRHSKVRVVGLCNVPIEMRMQIAAHLGLPPEAVEIEYTGLNHLGWVRRVMADGHDITASILEMLSALKGPANIEDMDYPEGFLKALGMLPSPYLRYFYLTDRMYQEERDAPRSRAEEVMDLERELFAIYRDPGQDTRPALLDKRGGAWYSRVAVNVMAALLHHEPCIEVVNTRNGGAIAGLPEDASVEVNSVIRKNCITPLDVPPLPQHALALVQTVKAYERLTIRAAVERSYDAALMALVTHPLVPTVDKARAVLDDLVASGGFVPA
jgi:6-phospho-beta-glucosidase